MSNDVVSWLETLPVDEPAVIDGESVFLRVGERGTELGVILLRKPTDAQVLEVSRVGFQSALEYDAGLGLCEDEDALVLSRWLPNVNNWVDAARPLEALLNQTALWRVALARNAPKPAPDISPAERRLRAMLMEKR